MIGRYGKGGINSSGRKLAETLMRNEMIYCVIHYIHIRWPTGQHGKHHLENNIIKAKMEKDEKACTETS